MRGASAIQKLLQELPRAPVRVFLVWERVLWSDMAPPTSHVLGLLSDRRARQLWDPGRLVANEIHRALRQRGEAVDEDGVIWDEVILYPPGARWDGALPPAAYSGSPVVSVLEAVRGRLPAE